MKKIYILIFPLLISGCLTLSGDYRVFSYDSNGKILHENMILTAQGSGIYTAINGLCKDNPKGIVIIKDQQTGKELESESPHQCR